jgi:phosphatidylglycerophosphatase A
MDSQNMPASPPENVSQRLALVVASLGPVGHLPKAPGTWGSLFAVLVAPFVFLPLSLPLRLLVLVALFHLGSLAAGSAEKSLGRKDPGQIVIDELLGQWATLLPFVLLPWWQMLAAFALFRLFDVIKPWPIKDSEDWLAQGYGVMLDDLLAGLYAALVLFVLRLLVG